MQVTQRSCGYPIPASVQDQSGWGFWQTYLVEGDPIPVRELGTSWSLRSLPSKKFLLFCDFTELKFYFFFFFKPSENVEWSDRAVKLCKSCFSISRCFFFCFSVPWKDLRSCLFSACEVQKWISHGKFSLVKAKLFFQP